MWQEKPCKIAEGTDVKGYVMLRGTGSRDFRYAHRIAYRDAHGLVNEQMKGVLVLHHCDNPRCHEPTHLFAGTDADNMRDKVAKGRQLKGEQIKQAKLTEQQVRDIRARYVRGSATHGQYAIARDYNVTQSHICLIVRGDLWKHTLQSEGI